MNKEAIILAGGFGTRLKGVISDIPKPMAPIAGRPFLEYILTSLHHQNFKNIVLSVGHKSEVIQNYFGDNYKGIPIEYVVENEPLGTGGAIKFALEKSISDQVFVLNGDTIIDVDTSTFAEFCKNQKGDVGIVVKEMVHFDRYGTVDISNDVITQFNEKRSTERGFINCGFYYLNKKVIEQFQLPHKFSFETEFLEKYTSQLKFSAYKSNGYFIDIGIPEDYEKAKKELPIYYKNV